MGFRYEKGICEGCWKERIIVNKTHGLCDVCNKTRLTKGKPTRVGKVEEMNILPGLQKRADAECSIHSRIKNANGSGFVKCYTCPAVLSWKDIENGHYVRRRHSSVRYAEINNNPQCHNCNCVLDGNEKIYREQLVKEHGEVEVEWLERQKNITHKPSREELEIIADNYSKSNQEIFKRLALA